jgi:glutathione synthase/RimK-type ligase-like ATP-grasp enzyme
VVKPRFGSGGRDVVRCDDQRSLDATLTRLCDSPWYQQQGALVQELIAPMGYDLRILVAGERVVGAVFRIAAQGEWRTNIALGGTRRPVSHPPPEACRLAIRAARAAGSALVGVDLVPDVHGDWTVIELNGAVEFNHEYLPDGDVFADVAVELARCATDGSESTDSFSTAPV